MPKRLLAFLVLSFLSVRCSAEVPLGKTREELIKLYGLPIKDVDPASASQGKLATGETVQVTGMTFGVKTPLGGMIEIECRMQNAACFIVDMNKYDKSHQWEKFNQTELTSILNEYKQFMVKTYGTRTVNDWIDATDTHSYWIMPISDEPLMMSILRATADSYDTLEIGLATKPEKATSVEEIKARENAHAMSMIDWQAFVRKDSKLSALTALLGKPDIANQRDGLKVYGWYHKLDRGTKENAILYVLVAPYHDETIVVGMFEDYTTKAIMLPWSQKVLDVLQK